MERHRLALALSFPLFILSLCDAASGHDPKDCLVPQNTSNHCDPSSIMRYYYDTTANQCLLFHCEGIGNNFDDWEECADTCVDANVSSAGEILLVVNSTKNVKVDTANFEDGTFGKWESYNMEIIDDVQSTIRGISPRNAEVESRQKDTGKATTTVPPVVTTAASNASDSQQQSNDTAVEATTAAAEAGPTTTTIAPVTTTTVAPVVTTTTPMVMTKVAAPKYDIISYKNGTLVQRINFTEDYSTEIEFSLKVVGYNASLRRLEGNENPFFSLELVKDDQTRRDTLFDIRSYGKVFERNSDWVAIKYHFTYNLTTLSGLYDLTLTSRRGNPENSNVYLDNLVLRETTRLTVETARKMDAAAKEALNGTTTASTANPGSSTTTPAPAVSSAGQTAIIVLAVVVAVLVIVLAVVCFKYWTLRKELVGDYPVSQRGSASAGGASTPYNNPAFSGHNAADRYGTMHD